MTMPDLRAWADMNEAAGYACLAKHPPNGRARAPRRFGGCVAYPAGRQVGFFNPILVTEPTTADDLRAAVAWLHGLGQSLSLRIRDDLETDDLRVAARGFGLTRDPWVEVAMVMSPLATAPTGPPGLAIEVVDAPSIGRFHAAASAGFLNERADGLEFMRDLFPASLARDPDVQLFAGFLDGEPIASSVAIRSGPVAGAYSVATAPKARRRGIGSAMTWRVVEAAVAWGCEVATLQATEMGEPVYRAMGFEPVGGYVTWSAG